MSQNPQQITFDNETPLRLRALESAIKVAAEVNDEMRSAESILVTANKFLGFLSGAPVLKTENINTADVKPGAVQLQDSSTETQKTTFRANEETIAAKEKKPRGRKPAAAAEQPTQDNLGIEEELIIVPPAGVKATQVYTAKQEPNADKELATEIDYDSVVAPAVFKFAASHGKEKLRTIFAQFGAKQSAKELKPSQYFEFLHTINNYKAA